jgi:hypothetical protein
VAGVQHGQRRQDERPGRGRIIELHARALGRPRRRPADGLLGRAPGDVTDDGNPKQASGNNREARRARAAARQLDPQFRRPAARRGVGQHLRQHRHDGRERGVLQQHPGPRPRQAVLPSANGREVGVDGVRHDREQPAERHNAGQPAPADE